MNILCAEDVVYSETVIAGHNHTKNNPIRGKPA